MKRVPTRDNLEIEWKSRKLDSFYACTINPDRACYDVVYCYVYYFCCCGWVDTL